MAFSKNTIANIIIYLVAITATVYCLSDMVIQPGKILLSTHGDAAKNYYTYLYHAQYGNGIWFEGMNYPYGEHIVFADAQPVLSVIFSWLFAFISPLAALHLSIAISFFLSIIFLCRIMQRFQVSISWALLFAVLITAMSPQVLKLSEHFSLAYFCVIPIVFYCNLAYYQDKHREYLLYLFAATLLFTSIHLYFAAIICFWIVGCSIIYLVFIRTGIIEKIKHIIPLCVAAVTPFVLIKLLLLLTDPATDRPAYPWGARWNRTFLNDIYTSFLSPISNILKEADLVAKVSSGGEGFTYTGIMPIIILTIAAILSLFVLIRNRSMSFYIQSKYSLSIWLLIAAGMLIAGTSIIFQNCFTCLDHAAFIRQFRAMGRFSWGYYYITTVSAVVLLFRGYTYLLSHKKSFAAVVMFVFAIAIWMTEALPYAHWTRALAANGEEHYTNFFKIDKPDWNKILMKEGYSANDFQAILLLPYVHIGTEKVSPHGFNGDYLAPAFSASLSLQLPVIDVMMSRSAWSEAFGQQKIAGGPYADKPLLRNMESNKPLLLLHNTKEELDPDELYLLKAAEKLHQYEGCDLYILYPEKLKQLELSYRQDIATYLPSLKVGDTALSDNGSWHIEHFEDQQVDQKLFGTGSFGPISSIKKIIFDSPHTPTTDSVLYELSIWSLLNDDDYRVGRYRLMLHDDTDSLIAQYKILAQEATDNYGMWVRANTFFYMPENCARISVELIDIIKPSYIAVDELMIRPATTTILSKDEHGRVMVNNHIYRP